MGTHEFDSSQHLVDCVLLAPSRWRWASVVQKQLGVDDEVQQMGLVLAVRTIILVKLKLVTE